MAIRSSRGKRRWSKVNGKTGPWAKTANNVDQCHCMDFTAKEVEKLTARCKCTELSLRLSYLIQTYSAVLTLTSVLSFALPLCAYAFKRHADLDEATRSHEVDHVPYTTERAGVKTGHT